MQKQFSEEQMLLKTLYTYVQRKIPLTILQKLIQHGYKPKL